MSGQALIDKDSAQRLRQAFDESFAAPSAIGANATTDLIALRLNGDLHAIRMEEIGSLLNNVDVTALPGPLPELCGVAAFRGIITPVYDLAQILGYPRSRAAWVVLSADRMVALAFESFAGQFRVETAAIADSQPNTASRHIHQVALHNGSPYPIISVAAVTKDISARVPQISRNVE
jgi:chemotaxis signal transduction protein